MTPGNSPRSGFRTMTVVSTGGARLHTEIHGPDGAPTVVLVHGWTCRIAFWHPVLDELVEPILELVVDRGLDVDLTNAPRDPCPPRTGVEGRPRLDRLDPHVLGQRPVEHRAERQQLLGLLLNGDFMLLHVSVMSTAATLLADSPARVIDDHLTHRARRNGVEVIAILPIDFGLIHQL